MAVHYTLVHGPAKLWNTKFPINVPDLTGKRFGYGHASSGHYGQRRAGLYARSDFLHLIRFRSSKEGPDHTVQNRPRPDRDGLVNFFFPNRTGPEVLWLGQCEGSLFQSNCAKFPG